MFERQLPPDMLLEAGTCCTSAVDFPVEKSHTQQITGDGWVMFWQNFGVVGSTETPDQVAGRVSDDLSHWVQSTFVVEVEAFETYVQTGLNVVQVYEAFPDHFSYGQ